jgi:hypothetical protein
MSQTLPMESTAPAVDDGAIEHERLAARSSELAPPS